MAEQQQGNQQSIRSLIEQPNQSQVEKLDQLGQLLHKQAREEKSLSAKDRSDLVSLTEQGMATKRVEISGSDPAAKAANKMLEPQQMAAMGLARSMAHHDKEADNPFKQEQLRKAYDSERAFLSHAKKNEKPAPETPQEPSPAAADKKAEKSPRKPDARPQEQESEIEGKPGKKDKKVPLPDHIAQRYWVDESIGGVKKFTYSNQPEKVAFTETKNKLTTSEKPSAELVGNMLDVAESKGWDKVNVNGNDEFRRAVWLKASLRGLDVKGYKPTESDKQKLDAERKKSPGSIRNAEDKAKEPGTASEKQDQAEPKNPKFREARSETRDTPSRDQPQAQERPAPQADRSKAPDKPSEPQSDMAYYEREAQIQSSLDAEREANQAFTREYYQNREEAVKKTPELAKIDENVIPNAKAYFKQQGGLKSQEKEFVKKVEAEALRRVSKGQQLPHFNVPKQRQTETGMER